MCEYFSPIKLCVIKIYLEEFLISMLQNVVTVVFSPECYTSVSNHNTAQILTINLYTDKNQWMVFSLKAEHINKCFDPKSNKWTQLLTGFATAFDSCSTAAANIGGKSIQLRSKFEKSFQDGFNCDFSYFDGWLCYRMSKNVLMHIRRNSVLLYKMQWPCTFDWNLCIESAWTNLW